MAERKPVGLGWETWVDRQIREAQERGEFDNLSGAGKPIPGLDRPTDDLWWIRSWMQREGVSLLPPSLELRRHIEKEFERIGRMRREQDVRAAVAELNERILETNRHAEAAALMVKKLDADAVVARWRETRKIP